MCDYDEIYTLISNCKLFQLYKKDKDHVVFDKILNVLELWEFSPGQSILTEGTEGSEVYFIYRGIVEFSSQGIMLGTKEAGSYFGEIAVFTNAQRTCSAIARTPTQLLVLKRDDFKKLVQQHPAVFIDAVKTTYDQYCPRESHVVQRRSIAQSRMKSVRRDYFSQSTTGDIRTKPGVSSVVPATRTTEIGISATGVPGRGSRRQLSTRSTQKSSLVRKNFSLGSGSGSTKANRLQMVVMAKLLKERLVFNTFNTALDGRLNLPEFTEVCSLQKYHVTLQNNESAEEVFEQIPQATHGFVTESEFCEALETNKIALSEQLMQQLMNQSAAGPRTRWKEFLNDTIWYLGLPVSILLAPGKVRQNILQRVEISAEIEVQSIIYRNLKNQWTANQIKTHCNWQVESDLPRTLDNEASLFEKMSLVETRIALLKEWLASAKLSAVPGAFNVLEFFIHTIPPFAHTYIDEVLTCDKPDMIQNIALISALCAFSFTFHLCPITIAIVYTLYQPEALVQNGISLSEVYMPFLFFTLIVLMQAVQDAVTIVSKDDREAKALQERRALCSFNVECTEGHAANAEDLYDWLAFLATRRYGDTSENEGHHSNVQLMLLSVLTLIHGFIPMVLRVIYGQPAFGCDEVYCYAMVTGSTWSSMWLFWSLMDYLMIGYRVYNEHRQVLNVFVHLTNLRSSKKHGLPFLSMDRVVNVLAWSKLRQFIISVDEWKYRWIDSMLTSVVAAVVLLFVVNVTMIMFSAHVDTFLVLNLYDITVIAVTLLFVVQLMVKVELTRMHEAFVLHQIKWDLTVEISLNSMTQSSAAKEVKYPVKHHLESASVGRRNSISVLPVVPSSQGRKITFNSSFNEVRPAVCCPKARVEEMERCVRLIAEQINIIERSSKESSSKILGFTVDGGFMVRLTFLCASFVLSLLFRFSL